mmetsp:Transcript_88005/g.249320  ORF Transcript_88005/g.249320 Transcript_88005/m.249320 type:complete len:341 (-) Transcript_88005:455-1477(-)
MPKSHLWATHPASCRLGRCLLRRPLADLHPARLVRNGRPACGRPCALGMSTISRIQDLPDDLVQVAPLRIGPLLTIDLLQEQDDAQLPLPVDQPIVPCGPALLEEEGPLVLDHVAEVAPPHARLAPPGAHELVALHPRQRRAAEQSRAAGCAAPGEEHAHKGQGVVRGAHQAAAVVAHQPPAGQNLDAALGPCALRGVRAVDAHEPGLRGHGHGRGTRGVQVAPGCGIAVDGAEAPELVARHPEGRVLHPQRIEEPLPEESAQVQAGADLEHAAQDVRRVPVFVAGAGLAQQRHGGQLVHELRQRGQAAGLHALDKASIPFLHLARRIVEVDAVRKAGRV